MRLRSEGVWVGDLSLPPDGLAASDPVLTATPRGLAAAFLAPSLRGAEDFFHTADNELLVAGIAQEKNEHYPLRLVAQEGDAGLARQ